MIGNSAAVLFVISISIAAALAQEPNTGSGSSPKDGDACKVTAGSNKGKVGKYTSDATYCEGDWGATECAQSDGTSKCAAALTIHPLNGKEIAILRAYADAVAKSSDRSVLHAWETKYHAHVVKGSGGQVTIKLPTRTVTLDSSREGLMRLFGEKSR